ncbi:MAG TPA: hypothetical protein VGE53_00655 [Candidatus Paceibacterota bacterium]
MIDPNVLNYFLIVLGGFSVVCSYRFFAGKREEKIGEFEYAAFSAIWGIPVFMIFVEMVKEDRPEQLEKVLYLPMIGTPALVLIGILLGWSGALLLDLWKLGKETIKRKWPKTTTPNESHGAAQSSGHSPESISSLDQS